VANYRCVRPCRHNHKNFKLGDFVSTKEPAVDLPSDKQGDLRHFVLEREFSAELVAETAIKDRKEASQNKAFIRAQKAEK